MLLGSTFSLLDVLVCDSDNLESGFFVGWQVSVVDNPARAHDTNSMTYGPRHFRQVIEFGEEMRHLGTLWRDINWWLHVL